MADIKQLYEDDNILDQMGSKSKIVLRKMSSVQPEPIQWLWPLRIALGKVTLIAGDPGLGKSMVTAAFAKHVTTGAPWPVDGTSCPVGDVIMVSAEDDPSDTIRPRLDATEADVDRVHILDEVEDTDRDGSPIRRPFNIAKDIEALDEMLLDYPECRLITIDPISAYLGGTDSHNNADIRALLTPLAAMAGRHKVAIVVVTHLNKSSQANALYRASGSLAFVAAARAVYSVVKDPDDPDKRLFLPIKNNLGDDRTGFAYYIEQAANNSPMIQWEPEPVETTLEEMADAVTERKPRPIDHAIKWLQAALTEGEVAADELKERAESVGIAWRTVERAKSKLGIDAQKHAFDGKWMWSLPVVGQDQRYLNEVANESAPIQ